MLEVCVDRRQQSLLITPPWKKIPRFVTPEWRQDEMNLKKAAFISEDGAAIETLFSRYETETVAASTEFAQLCTGTTPDPVHIDSTLINSQAHRLHAHFLALENFSDHFDRRLSQTTIKAIKRTIDTIAAETSSPQKSDGLIKLYASFLQSSQKEIRESAIRTLEKLDFHFAAGIFVRAVDNQERVFSRSGGALYDEEEELLVRGSQLIVGDLEKTIMALDASFSKTHQNLFEEIIQSQSKNQKPRADKEGSIYIVLTQLSELLAKGDTDLKLVSHLTLWQKFPFAKARAYARSLMRLIEDTKSVQKCIRQSIAYTQKFADKQNEHIPLTNIETLLQSTPFVKKPY